MRNRFFDGRDHDNSNERPHSYESHPGHERGCGMANGRERSWGRDPHRVDDHRYVGRDDGMWSRYDYANEESSRAPGYDGYARTSPYAPAQFERARGDERAAQPQGRLPKGYTRSDERIREDVCDRLGMEVDASEVEVRIENGVVSLTGSVLDRQTKYQLEEIAERVLGVKDVQNHVTILRGAGSSLATTQRMDLGREIEHPRRSRH